MSGVPRIAAATDGALPRSSMSAGKPPERSTTGPVRPPVAPLRPERLEHHGDVRVDDYRWLRQHGGREVLAYIRAENRYAAAIMKPHADMERSLYREMKGRYREDDEQVPERRGPYYYFWRSRRGEAHKAFCRRADRMGAKARVLLDLNLVAERTGQTHLDLGAAAPSPDHALLAYTLDTTGNERYRLVVVECGDDVPVAVVEGVAPTFAWANDSRTLFYCRLNESGQACAVCRLDLDDPADGNLVFEEEDPSFLLSCRRSRSGEWLFFISSSNTCDEVRFLSADSPREAPRVIRGRAPGVQMRVAHHGRYFYIVTNDEAPNGRIVRAPVNHPGEWKDYLPHRPECLVERIDIFRNHLAVLERRNGLPGILVMDLASRRRHHVHFGEPAYELTILDNPEFDTGYLRFSYSSPLSPRTVYDYDMADAFKRARKVAEVREGWDPANYRMERLFATAPDGTRIPITLLARRGTRRDGRNPVYLLGYGAYGISASLAFSSDRFSLVDRGFIFAIAHVRGGQEMGRDWYEQGKLLNKRNTFTDYIACTEHLIRERWTSPGRVAASGVSAGGMLVGAVANMRPELYGAVVAHVPFVDVLSTMLDPELTLTANEYDEWGNPAEPRFYEYIRSYSPYDNVRPQPYPHMLVLAAYNDTRVPFWEAARWTARLRALKTDDHLLLLRTFMDTGHAGHPGRFEHLRELALEYAFLFAAFGIPAAPLAPDWDA